VRTSSRRLVVAGIVGAGVAGVAILFRHGSWRSPLRLATQPEAPRTHQDVLMSLGPKHRRALRDAAAARRIAYPPRRLTLVGLKHEKALEVWVERPGGWLRFRSYPVLAASGGPGPKRREGDFQVPEGLYRITAFNPNSRYHLSVRVDYPNADDRAAAHAEGRSLLGGDIFIHGRAVSIGCLAIGDDAIEELYVLLADVGLTNVRLILSPSARPRAAANDATWVRQLYQRLEGGLHTVRGPAQVS